MRQSPSPKRGRGRSGGRRPYSNPASRSFDSSGPDVKVRGTATHIFDKYQTLARDASSSGDRVAAENYLQHAEHYYRIFSAQNANQGDNVQGSTAGQGQNQGQQQGSNQPQAGAQPDTRGQEQPAAGARTVATEGIGRGNGQTAPIDVVNETPVREQSPGGPTTFAPMPAKAPDRADGTDSAAASPPVAAKDVTEAAASESVPTPAPVKRPRTQRAKKESAVADEPAPVETKATDTAATG